jgi:negative regulator of flagellin synthesis FlgM
MKIPNRNDLVRLPDQQPGRTNGTRKAAAEAASPEIRPGAPAADVDAAKVQAITAAIREGRFKVNAEAVAERLLEDVREMLAGKR